ncbi:hypothetical protein [Lactobacillus sp. ESL0677]|uniref:hypothetical protein n=1 Tax=Lactobacillus sp. ESL0677 TaxID=2983208 RepID=UPI0023F7BC06|nr:hypothetical protein [Lactobacillus sp. ESL0677]WEV37403.1 hypothetical protein OZX76_02280 [Lactobacillus sp. ESL0677]
MKLNSFIIIIGLLVLFWAAREFVARVYHAGHQIYSVWVEVISIFLLIPILVYCKNTVVVTIAVVIFAFNCMIFLIAFSRNFNAIMRGEGNSTIARWVRKSNNKQNDKNK